ELRWVPLAPVFQCESCLGSTGSLISHSSTPSSCGLVGSAPQATADFCNAVSIRLSCSVTWMFQVLFAPGMNLTNFGSRGSVTSRMLQPKCHRWLTYMYQRPFTFLIAILKAPLRLSTPL